MGGSVWVSFWLGLALGPGLGLDRPPSRARLWHGRLPPSEEARSICTRTRTWVWAWAWVWTLAWTWAWACACRAMLVGVPVGLPEGAEPLLALGLKLALKLGLKLALKLGLKLALKLGL